MSMILAGDIGGTKTTLALVPSSGDPRSPSKQETFSSRQFSSLESVIAEFLMESDGQVESASFGVAGPIIEGRTSVTNLPWVIDESKLREHLGVPLVIILNDLVALAEAVPLLTHNDLQTLNKGAPPSHGSLAVIAPGTGLGEAFLAWDGMRYRSYPSEGGHADFAPRSAQEIGLLVYLSRRFDHVSYERVCSGMGLPLIYEYLKETGAQPESSSVRAQLKTASDPTPVIIRAALAKHSPCRLCRETLNLFVAILAAEASNLALKVLATGGVYLGGGIPPRILTVLKEARFFAEFTNKGRFKTLMQNIPVHVITNPHAALFGAASVAMRRQTVPYNS